MQKPDVRLSNQKRTFVPLYSSHEHRKLRIDLIKFRVDAVKFQVDLLNFPWTALGQRGPDQEGAILHGPQPWTGKVWGEISPVPGSAIAADEHWPTCSTDLSTIFPFPSEVAREETLGPLTLGRGLNSIAKSMREIDLATDRKVDIPHQISTGHLLNYAGLQQSSAAQRALNLFAKHAL